MSIELEQMRQLTAAHDDPQSSIHGNIITTEAADGVFARTIVDFRAILARMEAAENVVELARQWLHCADVINETFGSHGPIKDTETLSRRNVEYMDATDAMCAAIRQSKGTT